MGGNIKRLLLLSAGLSALTSLVVGGTVQALHDPISSGLWQGANMLQLDDNGPSDEQVPYSLQQKRQASSDNMIGGMYVALGDSVAAGLGLGEPLQNENNPDCGRSTKAYPHLVSQSLRLPLMHAACSGAAAGDLTTKQAAGGTDIASQLDSAYMYGKPGLITITAGANDLRWADFLRKCYANDCGTKFDSAVAATLRSAMEAKYRYALSSIQARSNYDPPTVVLTGYYNPISDACIDSRPYVTTAEIKWLNQQRVDLNKTIRQVAESYPFARYASTDFSDHSLCSGDSWVQGIDSAAPLHPNEAGQEAIARSVLSVLGR